MDETTALRRAHAIVSAWDCWEQAETETKADDRLQAAINDAAVSIGTEFEWRFLPVLQWQGDNPDDYTMDECCAVLRAFLADDKAADVATILKAAGFRR